MHVHTFIHTYIHTLLTTTVRADEAAYLRNTDRSLDLSGRPSLSPPSSPTEVALTQSAVEEKNPVVLVLDNLRSAFNVGSIFRSAETAGLNTYMHTYTHAYTCSVVFGMCVYLCMYVCVH